MIAWILIFLFSVGADFGAVLFTRAVQLKKILFGTLTTGILAALNWFSILLVFKQDDDLVYPAIVGHMVGFVIGMIVPVGDESEKERPTAA